MLYPGRDPASHPDVVSTGRRERLAGEHAYAKVVGEIFDGADLSSVCLDRLRLDRCSLVAADLRQATLDHCRFKFCDLRRARLQGASLRFAHLAGRHGRRGSYRHNVRPCRRMAAPFAGGGPVNGAETGQDSPGNAPGGTRVSVFWLLMEWLGNKNVISV
jgi:hypothetical protein